jgi:hypothetical protein
MSPAPGDWDSLRLAAKAADRAKAAERLRPSFEKRLGELGYGSLAIAHAFSALAGPSTVQEALAELAENARRERIVPVPLDFEVLEPEHGLPVAHPVHGLPDGHSLAITAVQREARGIRVTYEIRPPLPSPPDPPHIEARDDCDQDYRGFGQSIGLAGSRDSTITLGSFVLPLPQPHASLLRVRISWSPGSPSPWESPAHELRITL